MYSARRSMDPEDPLAAAIAPPPGETVEERVVRLRKEADAKRVNDEIEERIKQDRVAWKTHKSMFKLLLLGQSESGKSTTLKNFQLAFAPKAWKAERASWRAVIQLNLVRSINYILDVLSAEMSKSSSTAATPHPSDALDSPSPAALLASPSALQFGHTHALLKLRLAPLRRVEADLKQLIGAATCEIVQDAPFDAPLSPLEDLEAAAPFPVDAAAAAAARRRPTEFYVRANNTWRESVRSAYYTVAGTVADGARPSADGSKLEDATEIIASCAEDMAALWADPVVHELLRRRKIRMELSPGFFLNDVGRIARRDYEPSDQDVVRSRLRTVGVQECKLVMENYEPPSAATEVSREWMIYDVGGSRTSRAAWFPFFDDAHAILFLAPISCFDELLAEDRRVNRLEDSFLLWKGIVQSKLLAKCIIVLFLNKFDLLERKLEGGARVNRYLPSFADRENSAPTLARYLYKKFRDQHREYSPHVARPFYGYVTTVIDTKATASTLTSVRDGLLRHNLEKANFV